MMLSKKKSAAVKSHIAAPECVKNKLFLVCKSEYLNNFLSWSAIMQLYRIVWILCKMGFICL